MKRDLESNYKYKLEYKVGSVSLIESNLLVNELSDMETLEYWENRLTFLKQNFAVLYRTTLEGKIVYAIYTEMSKKSNVFR